MKNIIKSILAVVLFAGVTSCTDEQDLLISSPSSVQFTTISPDSGTAIVLAEDAPENPALTLSWNPANYDGTATQITYEVEVDKDGNNFATPQVVGSTTSRSLTVLASQLNPIVRGYAQLPEDPAAPQTITLNVRIKATVGTTGSQPSYSNVINYTVTPYIPVVLYPYTDLFLVGNAIDTNMDGVANDSDWNNNAHNPALYRDPAHVMQFTYVGYFIAGDFKLLTVKGQWQPQIGPADGSTLATNDGTGSDPNPFHIGTAGYYKLFVDLEANTYTLAPYDASGDASYATIGIIGTATPNNWDSPDTDMTQSAFDPHLWYIDSQLLKANQEMKFRANDAWDISWGASTSFSGFNAFGGGNIPVTLQSDGNYNIWFSDLDGGKYIYIPLD